jgi:hypothetical protein
MFGLQASGAAASWVVGRMGTDAHLYDDPDDASIPELLDSRFDADKVDALKRLLALIAQGVDVAHLFPQVTPFLFLFFLSDPSCPLLSYSCCRCSPPGGCSLIIINSLCLPRCFPYFLLDKTTTIAGRLSRMWRRSRSRSRSSSTSTSSTTPTSKPSRQLFHNHRVLCMCLLSSQYHS